MAGKKKLIDGGRIMKLLELVVSGHVGVDTYIRVFDTTGQPITEGRMYSDTVGRWYQFYGIAEAVNAKVAVDFHLR